MTLLILADVAPSEREVVRRAAERLKALLSEAGATMGVVVEHRGTAQPVHAPQDAVVVLSLAPAPGDWSALWSDASAALRARVEEVAARGPKTILMTMLRHVRDAGGATQAYERLVRIRRLNLMAIELSHALGVCVADIDRDLADVGAGPLGSDHHLGSDRAVELAAWSLVRCIALNALDGLVDFETQDRIVAANARARPQQENGPYVLEHDLVQVRRGRRTQSAAAAAGGAPASGVVADLLGRAFRRQIRPGEIRTRVARAVRQRRVLSNLLRLGRELAAIAARRRR